MVEVLRERTRWDPVSRVIEGGDVSKGLAVVDGRRPDERQLSETWLA
jgi:hypothetical protein